VSRRAVAPVVGVALMLVVCVVFAGVVGAFVVDVGEQTDDAPTAAITAKFGNEHPNQINLTHRGGDPIDVRDLTVRIYVDGEPLEHQPDVPGMSKGLAEFPTGPFNSGTANSIWTAGETASLTVATTTNSPQPSSGSRVTVKLYVNGTAVTATQV